MDEKFEAVAKDHNGKPVVMLSGSQVAAQTRMIRVAGDMVAGGWNVTRMSRHEVQMQNADNPGRRTRIWIRRIP